MSFGTRYGFEPEKEIQINSIDYSLRNRLYNYYCEIRDGCDYDIISFLMDKLGQIRIAPRSDERTISNIFLGKNPYSKWYSPYDILELCLKYKNMIYQINQNPDFYKQLQTNVMSINIILEEEKSGYRVINYEFTPITDEQEIDSIENAMSNPYGAVSTHMKKALELYSDRNAPDYENSIKESISAVESMCCVITGESGSQATLGKMLKKLEENKVTIHPSMREAFNKLYGYTSDADGIRHGGIDFSNAPAEDALYMLVSCSAFINYIKQKYESVK